MKTKVCPTCKRKKPLKDFSKDKFQKDGLRYQCKLCGNKGQRKKYKKYSRKYSKENWANGGSYQKRCYRLKSNYGITIDDYNNMFQKQNGCCLICNRHQSELKQKLNVDHSHKDGKVRGLLCGDCNRGLGCFKDNIEFVKNALNYLM